MTILIGYIIKKSQRRVGSFLYNYPFNICDINMTSQYCNALASQFLPGMEDLMTF